MKSASDDPLALHVLLASHTLDAWNYEGGVLRSILQRDVRYSLDRVQLYLIVLGMDVQGGQRNVG